MTTVHDKHTLRRSALGASLILGLLLLIHLVLPYAVNIQEVRDRIVTLASATVAGAFEFGTLKPALLPAPHVVVEQVRISVPEKVDIRLTKAIVYLKIWPLLSGTLKPERLKLVKPDILLHSPPPEDLPQYARHPSSILMIQKQLPKVLAQLVSGLGHFNAKVVDGRATMARPDRSEFVLFDLYGRFKTTKEQLSVEMHGSSPHVNRFDMEAGLDMTTLDSYGQLSLTGLHSQGMVRAVGAASIWQQIPLTVLNLDLTFRSKAMAKIDLRFSAQTPALTLSNGPRQLVLKQFKMDGRADWSPRQTNVAIANLQSEAPRIRLNGALKWSATPTPPDRPIQIDFKGAEVNIAQIRDALAQLYGNHPVVRRVLDIVRGGTVPWLTGGMSAAGWSDWNMRDHFWVECNLVDGRIMVPENLLDLKKVNGRVLIARGRLSAHKVSAHYGNTSAEKGSLILGLYDGSRAFDLDALVDADAAQLPKVLRKIIKGADYLALLDQLPSMAGRISGRLRLGDRLDRMIAQITATSHIKTGDSEFDLMGTIEHLPSPETSIRLFTRGRIGPKLLDYLWQAANASPDFILAPPFFVNGADISWHPRGSLTVGGQMEKGSTFQASAHLTVQKDDFHLKHLHLKSGESNALVAFRHQKSGQLLDAGFEGHVGKNEVDQLFRKNQLLGGWLKGRFQVHMDQRKPERTALHGQLTVRQLDLSSLMASPLKVLESTVHGLNDGFSIPSMSLTWDDQAMGLSGKGIFSQNALALTFNLNAAAMDAEKIIPLFKTMQPAATSRAPRIIGARPIRADVVVDIDQLDYGRYRIAPFRAAIAHGEDQVQVDVSVADVCGIQLPGYIRYLPDGTINMELQPKVSQSELKAAGSCLLDAQHTERLEGIVKLDGKISTRGRSNDELITNLTGNVDLHVGKGRIFNVGSAGLFTNLLSFLSVNQYLSGELPDLSQNDFFYNRIDAQMKFKDGLLLIEEGMVKSNSVNIVADGQYHLASKNLDLQMLVSPLTTVDWLVERIPIIGTILGGTLVAIPVRVKGHQSDPTITPLALSSVGARLGGILKRTVETPVRIIEPLLKEEKTEE